MKTIPVFLPMLLVLVAQLGWTQSETVVTLPEWAVAPEKLGQISSDYRDVNLSLTPNGRYLYFMSGRGEMPWSTRGYTTYRGKSEHDGDVWFSKRENGEWLPPKCVGQPICTSRGEDEPNISADGQTVYFQSWKYSWRSTGGPYYLAELRGNQWGEPVGLGGGIHAFFRKNSYATDGMSISPDGNIFIVAAGPDYDGAMDLYISRKENGVWGPVEKLSISTPQDERSVFIGADNKTIYFGSAGYGGFGGLDIFKTTLEAGAQCGTVINIGAPFNTAAEDYGFVMDAVRNEVYFVRNSDIYFAPLGEEIDVRIKTDPVVVMDGVVVDSTGKAAEATISLVYQPEQEVVAKARSNAITGEYSLSFPRKEGEYLHETRFNESYALQDMVQVSEDTPVLIEKEVVADPAKIYAPKEVAEAKTPEPVVMTPKSPPTNFSEKVWFDFDKAILTIEAKETLDRVCERFSEADDYTLELIGHTDNVGGETYNQQLSQERVEAVAAYLLEKGVGVKISQNAQGEKEPAVDNRSPENRAKNRRVEINVMYQRK